MKIQIFRLVFVMLTVCAFQGCFITSDGPTEFKRTRETKAMSFLKKYQTAASINQSETGHYASLSELYKDGSYEGIISQAFYKAWDGSDWPEPLYGYLYSSIDNYAYGNDSKVRNYAGLCAYPAEPGTTGDLIICILADPRHLESGAVLRSGGVSHGKAWTFYTAMYSDIGGPIYDWPYDEELEQKFYALPKRSPEKGLREAQRMADEVLKQQ